MRCKRNGPPRGERSGMRRIAILVAVAALAAFAAAGAQAKVVTVTSSANGKAVTLKVGDHLLVALASNPTTGYQWKVKTVTRSVLLPTGSSYAASASRPGAGGAQTLRFRAAKAGSTGLVLVYQQAGSKNIGKRFRLTVRVRA